MTSPKHNIQVIELIGPTGSGKSTFVKSALRESSAVDDIEQAAFRGLLHHPNINIPGKKLWRILPLRLLHKLRITKITKLYRDQIIRDHSQNFEDLLQHVYTSINQLDIPASEKFWLCDKFAETIANHILIDRPVNRGRKILADEFFLQKALSIFSQRNSLKNNPQESLDYYLKLIPIPAGVLTFSTDPVTCISRARQRNRGLPKTISDLSDEKLVDNIKQQLESCDKIKNSILKHTNRTVKFAVYNEEKSTTDLLCVQHEIVSH